MGAPRRRRFPRGSATRGPPARRAPGAVVDRPPGFHVSGAQGLALWCFAGATGISRALGDRLSETRKTGRPARLVNSALHKGRSATGRIDGVVSPRGTRFPCPVSRCPFDALVVGPARNAPRAARLRDPLGAEHCLAREPRPGGPAARG